MCWKTKPGALKVEYAKNLNTKSFELSVGGTAKKSAISPHEAH